MTSKPTHTRWFSITAVVGVVLFLAPLSTVQQRRDPILSLRTLKSPSELHTGSTLSLPPEPPPIATRVLISTLFTHSGRPDSLEILSATLSVLLSRALGGCSVILVPVALEHADVLVVSQYGKTDDLPAQIASAAANHRNHSLILFFALENTDSWGGEDGFVDLVDVSFGQGRWNVSRAVSRALAASNFLRFPAWIPFVLDPRVAAPSLAIHDALLRATDPKDWAARPRFAALLARHGGYPREDLCTYFDEIAEELQHQYSSDSTDGSHAVPYNGTARRWRLDRLGSFQNNVPVPPDADKLALLRDYRFNLAPENTKSRAGGYATEKLPEAHIAGTIPVYYGDGVFDTSFWNPARIVTLDDGEAVPAVGVGNGPGGSLSPAELIARVKRLETDPMTRERFFSEPVLAPTASVWLEAWFDAGARMIRDAIATHPVLRRRLLAEDSSLLTHTPLAT
jgi:hypothetical protein